MDEGVINLVKYFNSVGLKTYMSCEGHPERLSQHLFWISFDNSVTSSDIVNFVKNHSINNSCAIQGRFANRLCAILPNGEPWFQWHYFAANKVDAQEDYEYFISIKYS